MHWLIFPIVALLEQDASNSQTFKSLDAVHLLYTTKQTVYTTTAEVSKVKIRIHQICRFQENTKLHGSEKL